MKDTTTTTSASASIIENWNRQKDKFRPNYSVEAEEIRIKPFVLSMIVTAILSIVIIALCK